MVGFFTENEVPIVKQRKVGKTYGCSSCQRYLYCESPKFEPFGDNEKGIMNIFSYPTEMQDVKGDMSQNKNVRYVAKYLASKGIDLARDCTNLFAVACYSSQKNTPLPAQIEACRDKVFEAIAEYHPKLILLHGEQAIKSVVGRNWHKDFGTFRKWTGHTIPDVSLNAWVCPLFLASSKEDGEEYTTLWKQDMDNALSKLCEVMDYVEPNYTVYMKEEHIVQCLSRIIARSKVEPFQMAFDYETTGLKPHKTDIHRIVCVSFSFRFNGVQKTYCIKYPESEEGCTLLKRILRSSRISKIAHNLIFEEMWSEEIVGCSVTPWGWDTILGAHLLDSRDNTKSLKFQTYVNFGVAGYDDEVSPYLKGVDNKDSNSLNRLLEYIKNVRNYKKVMEYCAMDSLYTLALAEKQQSLFGGSVDDDFYV